jgi:uncharacterized protein (TIGR01370 family)
MPTFRWFSLAVCAAIGAFEPSLAPANPPSLSQVRSFEYAIAASDSYPSDIYQLITSSPSDLVILGGGNYTTPLNRSLADPAGNKLIVSYIDVGEAAPFWYPQLFANGTVPSWFGNPNPGYKNLYTVQYWNPAWEPLIFGLIDDITANGYDGIFLDVLGADSEWSAGNVEGNPVYANAVPALAQLLTDIRTYVNSKNLNRPFYLIGNNPTRIGLANPATLKNLDAIFNEVLYWGQDPTNGAMSQYKGTANAQYVLSTLAPLYNGAGVPVFGNDYPYPLTDQSTVFPSFAFYSALGWVPSATTAQQTANIFTTGPFMFMAVPANPTVTGTPNFVNYLSGGLTSQATLIGGDQGDYFIGGLGQNAIVGGAGNDTIYAHPGNAALKNILDFQITSTNKNETIPAVAININGQPVVSRTPITAIYQVSSQDFQVNVSPYLPISSVSIVVTGASYVNQNQLSNIVILGMTLEGQPIPLSTGTYTNGASNTGFTYSNNGSITFPGSAFQVPSPYLANTSDTIDGGGGVNTVIYRGPYNNYTVTQQADGSWLVTSAATAEGPDTLRNIQSLVFADQTVALAQMPQTGYWWNPAEAGRGYFLESNGNDVFMAAFLYDPSGRSSWYGAGPAPMTGSTFSAPLSAYSGGQTLTGSYQPPTLGASPGNISITFSDATDGTLTWPGGTIPLTRFSFAANGLSSPPTATQPQTGWWWNPAEAGRGYSVEVQNDTAFVAAYMYDGSGNPVWYASGPATLTTGNTYQGTWTSYTGGQTLTGTYQPPTGTSDAGSLTIQFSSPTAGTLTLPNGNQIPIQRFGF